MSAAGAPRGSQRMCISIDVDPIPCYYRIHALGPPPPELRSRILCAALPRFARLFAERSVPATFFVVAEDIDAEAIGPQAGEMRAVLRDIAEQGHEIASHSYSHPYQLARLGRDACQREIGRAHDLLSELAGSEVRGFRAPGYDISPLMLEALLERSYLYDSSVFPAPGYYLAKAVVMAALEVRGRKSGAVMTNARALAAPVDPYQPAAHAPWKRGDSNILELPVAVTRRSRTPVIGTNLLLAPAWLRRHWLRSMAGREFFNFELHAIDLCDAEEDELPAALVARQPDLRVPLQDKLARLTEIIDEVAARGSEFCTLQGYATARAPVAEHVRA